MDYQCQPTMVILEDSGWSLKGVMKWSLDRCPINWMIWMVETTTCSLGWSLQSTGELAKLLCWLVEQVLFLSRALSGGARASRYTYTHLDQSAAETWMASPKAS